MKSSKSLRWTSLAVFVAAAQAQDRNPFQGNKEAAESGRGMFRIYCSPCHGIAAQGGRAPDLTMSNFSNGNSDSDLFRVISGGAAGTEMPAFSERFDGDGIWRLITYIRSVSGKPVPALRGDRAFGEKLFWGKGGCGACHRVSGKGGRMGPDLSLAGRQRSLAYLKESLIAPNAALTPGYPTITVVTKDGKQIMGTQRGYDGFSAQLMDSSENFHSYLRDEVAGMKREFKSLMPSNYGKQFSSAEIDHLLVYITSLRGGKQ